MPKICIQWLISFDMDLEINGKSKSLAYGFSIFGISVFRMLIFLNHDVVLETSFVQISAQLESFLSFSLRIILHFKCFFRPILVLKCDQGFVGYKASFWGLCLFCPIHFYQLKRANKPFLSHMDHCAAESAVSFFSELLLLRTLYDQKSVPESGGKRILWQKILARIILFFSVAKYGTAKNIDSPHC